MTPEPSLAARLALPRRTGELEPLVSGQLSGDESLLEQQDRVLRLCQREVTVSYSEWWRPVNKLECSFICLIKLVSK